MKVSYGFGLDGRLKRTVLFSSCGLYRYRLTREWNSQLPSAAFIMLNPSVADASVDDPTIRRCVGFAKAWGCGSVEVVNLFGYRATDPRELLLVRSPLGPDNDYWLTKVVESCPIVVAAWGTIARRLQPRCRQVRRLLASLRVEVKCLGRTKAGHPRHPLYVRAETALQPY